MEQNLEWLEKQLDQKWKTKKALLSYKGKMNRAVKCRFHKYEESLKEILEIDIEQLKNGGLCLVYQNIFGDLNSIGQNGSQNVVAQNSLVTSTQFDPQFHLIKKLNIPDEKKANLLKKYFETKK